MLLLAGAACGLVLAAAAGFWLFFAGGPGGTITGTVYFGGSPVSTGYVTFVASEPIDAVPIGADGKYEVHNVPFGEAKITVRLPPPEFEKFKEMPEHQAKEFRAIWAPKKFSRSPLKYVEPETTPLRFLVQRRRSEYDIRLEE